MLTKELPKPFQNYRELKTGRIVKIVCCPTVAGTYPELKLVVYRFAEMESFAMKAEQFLDGRFEYVKRAIEC
jgi:hypothetical protein